MNVENNYVSSLFPLTEQEKFYEEYQKARKDPGKLKEFLQEDACRKASENGWYIPERARGRAAAQPQIGADGKRGIRLIRHLRFSPDTMHSYGCFEILCVLNGICQCQAGPRHYDLQAGDLLFLPPEYTRQIQIPDADCILIHMFIQKEYIEDLFPRTLQDKGLIPGFIRSSLYLGERGSLLFHTQGDGEVLQSILDMYKEDQHYDEYSERLAGSMLMVFFSLLMRRYGKSAEKETSPQDSPGAARITEYLLSDLSSASLSGLAKVLGYDISYCSRYVRRQTGHSFTQLLRSMRLEKAKKLLLTTSMTISSISERLGFENPESFTRFFRSECHISPNQYRKKERNNET